MDNFKKSKIKETEKQDDKSKESEELTMYNKSINKEKNFSNINRFAIDEGNKIFEILTIENKKKNEELCNELKDVLTEFNIVINDEGVDYKTFVEVLSIIVKIGFHLECPWVENYMNSIVSIVTKVLPDSNSTCRLEQNEDAKKIIDEIEDISYIDDDSIIRQIRDEGGYMDTLKGNRLLVLFDNLSNIISKYGVDLNLLSIITDVITSIQIFSYESPWVLDYSDELLSAITKQKGYTH